MRITDIKVFPVREDKLKAFVSVVFDECFMVNDIKVINGKDGLFISMPSRRKRNGKFKDVAHPLNNETRQSMEREILAAYEAALDSSAGEHGQPGRERAPVRPAPMVAQAPEPAVSDAGGETPLPSVSGPERSRPDEARASARRQQPVGQSEQVEQAERAEQARPSLEEEDKTLEEVTELHLRDSFWGT